MKKVIDKQACSTEPIHRLGRVQSHGVYFGVEPNTLIVRYVSSNVAALFGLKAEDVLGASIADLISGEGVAALMKALRSPVYTYDNPMEIAFGSPDQPIQCDAVAHFTDGLMVVEAELKVEDHRETSGVDQHFGLTAKTLRCSFDVTELNQFADQMARDIKDYTGFDRTMVYRFLDSGDGEVIAEAREAHLSPFLGLRYPASDIPAQARELYRRSRLRIVCDVSDDGHPILRHPDIKNDEPLDLSFSTLRAVSPVHLRYLKNMGVQASMSISLMTPAGDLWGLIACHHYSGPRALSYICRAACTHYGLVMSSTLHDIEQRLEAADSLSRRRQLSKALNFLLGDHDLQESLIANHEAALPLLDADGLAVLEGDWIETVGDCPSHRVVAEIIEDLETTGQHETILVRDHLSESKSYATDCAGLLRIRINPSCQVLAFRNENAHEVRWAGDPEAPYSIDSNDRLQPRESFAEYVQLARGRSRHWTRTDIVIATELCTALTQFVIQRNEQLQKLNKELANSNAEIQQFAYSVSHDLRSPLVTVNGYIQMIEEDLASGNTADVDHALTKVKSAVSRMGTLIDDLLTFSRIGSHGKKPAHLDLAPVFRELEEEFSERLKEKNIELKLPQDYLPILGIEQDVFRVFQNLIDNSIKYMPDDVDAPFIEITCGRHRRNVVCEVRDNGAGIDPAYHERVFHLFERIDQSKFGAGVGLASVAKIMEQHAGRIELDSVLGQGSSFRLFFLQPRAKGSP